MKVNSHRGALHLSRFVSTLLLLTLFAAPLAAQQPAPAKPPAQTAARVEAPAFDNLLSADTYKVYGEIRNVGQLLSNGGAGEILDPIVKLADPGPQFKAIVSFLKKNSEALGSSRLMFASWAARTDVPAVFVAIEFPNDEDAAKFAPKLEKFLPTVLPPVPVTPEPTPESQTKPGDAAKLGTTPKPSTAIATDIPSIRPSPATGPSPQVEERLPFVITHAGNLVCITDKSFKFSKLRPADSKPLFQDQNFRTARDQFSSEPIFFFFNVALEEQNKPKQIAADRKAAAQAEAERVRMEEEARVTETPVPTPNAAAQATDIPRVAVLVAGPAPSPTPTPTNEEKVQQIAGRQI